MQAAAVDIFPLSGYSIKTKEPQVDKEKSAEARFNKLREDFKAHGQRRSVEMVMVVDDHRHPHVLLLQLGQTFFKLPGGHLQPGESDQDGVNRILSHKFAQEGETREWPVAQMVCQWYRPNFETCLYPYVPPHVTNPKEHKIVYLIQLPRACTFEVPSNYRLIAVPVFELFDSKDSYGQVIASLPQLLSRFKFAVPHEPEEKENSE
eukprot:m.121101 g.121101  ORF g.121101 m.121101 type:complete len:206 (-) comp19610_c1_seq3:61-678(-)